MDRNKINKKSYCMPMYGTQLWDLGDILTDKFYIAMCVVYPGIWTENIYV